MGKCNLNKVSVFLMNEIEWAQITGKKEPQAVLEAMHQKYPDARTVLTLGKLGDVSWREQTCSHGIYKVPVVDTTDTFTGYFIASFLREKSIAEALHLASVASSISVTRKGATSSIPLFKEVEEANLTLSQ